ncbi:hypothetical protein DBR44_10860 [Aquitalea sp. FJL05]|uniref:capsular polysaccharide export protein, LipB/KpsS family n=1 Tax=Aquitalea TaxID=407217 RepID=UPI000F5A3849|nr:MULTISPECIES: galactosyltransferase-related protein [Aquitalea]RQO72813.1 hypothetical protein DBR44_10860 [Aquitalea sp. FJL05]
MKPFQLKTNHSPTLLEVIIPFRWTDKRPDLLDRLNYPLMDTQRPHSVHFTIADDGSPRHISRELEKICQNHGYNYLHIESELEPVCMSRARNIGVCAVPSEFIMFQDVDLMPYDGFYSDVLNEIQIQNLTNNASLFLMFGVIYLTQSATELYYTTPSHLRKNLFIQHLLNENTHYIEKFSTGTSVTVFNRNYYLSRGGYDEDFIEWGYEDIEFNTRCIRASRYFPLPENFLTDNQSFRHINRYQGWKSIYRLFGDITFQKGIVLFHSWHAIDGHSGYMKRKAINKQLFEEKVKKFSSRGEEPPPLAALDKGKTLCFSLTNPFIYNKKTAPLLGEIFYEDENNFTPEILISYIKKHDITRILFHNPYANEHRQKLFNTIKNNNIKFIIAERGALRNSVFFDDTGFNADSKKFDEDIWNVPITKNEQDYIRNYIIEEKTLDESLEKQAALLGIEATRKKLMLPRHKKIIFIPLQRPSDTVILHFCKKIGGYEGFIELIRNAISQLNDEYVFVIKKHPLEDETPDLPGAIFANNINIKDLLAISSAVLLINSGVGILGMLYEKPVLLAGDAFYGSPLLTHQVRTVSDIEDGLKNFQPHQETILRFLKYLIMDYYSFGHFQTREIPWKDTGRMTITTSIDFYQIRIPGQPGINYYPQEKTVPQSSILFDRYRTPKLAPPHPQPIIAEKPSISIQPKKITHEIEKSMIKPLPSTRARKIKKLREDPRSFLLDSRYRLLNLLGKIL